MGLDAELPPPQPTNAKANNATSQWAGAKPLECPYLRSIALLLSICGLVATLMHNL